MARAPSHHSLLPGFRIRRLDHGLRRNKAPPTAAPGWPVQRRLPEVVVAHVHRAANYRGLPALLFRLLDVGLLQRTRPEPEARNQRLKPPVDAGDNRGVIVLDRSRVPTVSSGTDPGSCRFSVRSAPDLRRERRSWCTLPFPLRCAVNQCAGHCPGKTYDTFAPR